jgi:hypothetical protein
MAIVDGSLQLGYKDNAWFTANASLVLLVGQIVYLEQTGTYKIGNGVTVLSALSFLGGGSGSGVQSVSGTNVDNTDPLNPIVLEQTGLISPDTSTSVYAFDNQASIISSDGVDSSSLTVQPDSIQLISASVTINSVNVATVNDIPSIAGLAPIASPTFTGTPLAPTAAANINNTQIATMAAVRGLLFYVTPEMYGAVGNGITDDTTALQNAINSGNAILLTTGKNYLVTTTLTTLDNTTIIGCGKDASISTTSNIAILSIQGQKNTIKGVTFIGNSTGAAQSGIKIDGNAGFTLIYINNIITDCFFENLLYAGIWIRNIIGSSSGSKNEGAAKISNCIITNCGYGVLTLTRGEYNSIHNCSISSCTTAGVSFTGGNNSISGGNIVNCAIGLEVLTGTNDGHSSAVGVMINHNTINFKATHTLGYVLNACMLYAGAITLTGTGKTTFIGCWFSMSGFNFTQTNSPCLMVDCEMVVVPNNFNLTGAKPILNNCYSGTSLLCYPDRTFASSYTLNANTTIAIPYSWGIDSISFRNTTANAVTGGIRIGTTNGGNEVVTAQAVGANELVQILPQDIKKYFFAHNATTTLYIQAVTAWNSASVIMQVKLKQWNNF